MVLVGRVLVLFFGTLAAPLAAQDSVLVVPDAPACATYSLTVSAVVELGDREGPGIVAQLNAPYAPARVVRSHDGDYYVSALGAGRTPAPILTRRGLSGCDWAARRGNGRVRLAGTVGGVADEPDQAGQPLHLYDEPSGRVTHSFGGEGVRSFQAGQPPTEVRRRVAPAADGQIRAASWNRYRIDKRSPNGDCIIRIEHDAPWFRPWEEGPRFAARVRAFAGHPRCSGLGRRPPDGRRERGRRRMDSATPRASCAGSRIDSPRHSTSSSSTP